MTEARALDSSDGNERKDLWILFAKVIVTANLQDRSSLAVMTDFIDVDVCKGSERVM